MSESILIELEDIGFGEDALLSLFDSGPFAATCHFRFVAGLSGRAHLDGGVLKGSGGDRHLASALRVAHIYIFFISLLHKQSFFSNTLHLILFFVYLQDELDYFGVNKTMD